MVDLDTTDVLVAECSRRRRARIEEELLGHLSHAASVRIQVVERQRDAIVSDSDHVRLAVIRLDSAQFDGVELCRRLRHRCEHTLLVAYSTARREESDALEEPGHTLVVSTGELVPFLSTACELVLHNRQALPGWMFRRRTQTLLETEHGPDEAGHRLPLGIPGAPSEILPVERLTELYARAAVRATGGNLSEAARRLQIDPKTLRRYLTKLSTSSLPKVPPGHSNQGNSP